MEDEKNFQELLREAAVVIAEHPSQVGTGVLQRSLRIGYGEASKLMEHLVEAAVVSEVKTVQGHQILVDNVESANARVDFYLQSLPRVPKA